MVYTYTKFFNKPSKIVILDLNETNKAFYENMKPIASDKINNDEFIFEKGLKKKEINESIINED